jgi:hypothetical protein
MSDKVLNNNNLLKNILKYRIKCLECKNNYINLNRYMYLNKNKCLICSIKIIFKLYYINLISYLINYFILFISYLIKYFILFMLYLFISSLLTFIYLYLINFFVIYFKVKV